MKNSQSKIVICVKDPSLLKELASLAKPFFEVIGCTDPEITAQSIVPCEISTFVTDSCVLLSRSRQMNPQGHRILVTDYFDFNSIVDCIQDGTIHHIVQTPVQSSEFLSSLLILFPAPRVFGGKIPHRPHAVGYWGAINCINPN